MQRRSSEPSPLDPETPGPSLSTKAIDDLIETAIEHSLQQVAVSDKLRSILTSDFTDLAASFSRYIQDRLQEQVRDSSTIGHDLARWLDQHLLEAKPSTVSLEEARHLLLDFFQSVVTSLVDRWLPALLDRLASSMPTRRTEASPSAALDLPSPRLENYLSVLSSLPYQALREALYKRSFEKVEDSPWPTAKLDKGSVRGHAQLRPPGMDTTDLVPPDVLDRWIQMMWDQHRQLSDLDADALDILSSIWINQARKPTDYAVADVDDILRMRGVQKKRGGQGRRGGYEAQQRIEILWAISHIQNLWITITEADVYEDAGAGRRRRPTRMAIQSRSFTITDRMGQIRLDGNMDVHRFLFQPGKVFAAFLFGPGRQTALLSAKALQYDPYRQTWEKRLARYLSWQWRAKARQSDYARPYKVSTLLEALGESVDTAHPTRTRDRLEKALDRLKSDGIISGWQYERWDESIAQHHGWSTHWLQATLLIDPPEAIRTFYRKIEAQIKTNPALLNAHVVPLGRQVRRRREELGLTQYRTAEQIGITQAYLSVIENHVRDERLSRPARQKLLAWLETHPSPPTNVEDTGSRPFSGS